MTLPGMEQSVLATILQKLDQIEQTMTQQSIDLVLLKHHIVGNGGPGLSQRMNNMENETREREQWNTAEQTQRANNLERERSDRAAELQRETAERAVNLEKESSAQRGATNFGQWITPVLISCIGLVLLIIQFFKGG